MQVKEPRKCSLNSEIGRMHMQCGRCQCICTLDSDRQYCGERWGRLQVDLIKAMHSNGSSDTLRTRYLGLSRSDQHSLPLHLRYALMQVSLVYRWHRCQAVLASSNRS